MKIIAIIGGGISGLAAAHRLVELSHSHKQPLKIILLEATSRLGGIIRTDEHDGFLIERGPDSFISEKPEALALTERLGIQARLIRTNEEHRRSFIVRRGRLRPVPEGFQLLAPTRLLPFVTSDIFSWLGKLRMAGELLLPRSPANGMADESLASFVRRRFGKEALERMAQPMVGGIYTADPERLSLRATLPRFLEMEREHRSVMLAMWRKGKESAGVSGARYSLFLSFDRGMQVLVDELKKKLAAATPDLVHVDIRFNTHLDELRRDGATGWTLRTQHGESLNADAVCVALPGYATAKLLQAASPQLAKQLNSIQYASTATINLGYRRSDISHPLDGFGFVVPFAEKRSLIACTFSSIKFSGRAPNGAVLLRAFVGGALQPDMFALPESEMIARVKKDLRELLGINSDELFADVTKWHASMPQYEVGHLDRVKSIEDEVARLPGLALAGNSYRGAGIPDCIRSGEAAAEKLFARTDE